MSKHRFTSWYEGKHALTAKSLDLLPPFGHCVRRASSPDGDDKYGIFSEPFGRIKGRIDPKAIDGPSPSLGIIVAQGQRFDADRTQTS
jgi:hypothetical protein